jgi:hypothetical protein
LSFEWYKDDISMTSRAREVKREGRRERSKDVEEVEEEGKEEERMRIEGGEEENRKKKEEEEQEKEKISERFS